MKGIFIALSSLFVLLSCNQESTKNTTPNVDHITQRSVILLNRFKCDSLETKGHSLYAYFSHSKSNFDEIQRYQFTHNSISMVRFNTNEIDSLIYIYRNKRSNKGDLISKELFASYENTNLIYSTQLMEEIVAKIFHYERISENNSFLNELNKDFAIAKHGNEISRKAEIGIDAIQIIYDYLIDCRNGNIGQNHQIIQKYMDSISQKAGESKSMHEKIVELIQNKAN